MPWEDREIESLVFDRRSLRTLARILKKGIVNRIVGKISEGKEAAVFVANRDEEWRAIKIYKPETSKFFNSRHKYIDNQRGDDFEIASAYAAREYKMLEIAYSIIQNVPKPIYREDNIVVMDFLGDNGIPYPQLHSVIDRDMKWFEVIIDMVYQLFRAGYVHGDLSEYNILVGDRIYMIDFGQATRVNTDMGMELLRRDVYNIGRAFHIDTEGIVERWISEES
ncbi:MAG: serine protein kinase RIO [Candidatus Micrarchaeota archaeon]|nr:serine protein kinase RIO [Candidatus Micrarchaeota archaeon]